MTTATRAAHISTKMIEYFNASPIGSFILPKTNAKIKDKRQETKDKIQRQGQKIKRPKEKDKGKRKRQKTKDKD
jgi:hypothetical protein